MTTVSVIIPVHNGADAIRASVEAALHQTMPVLEVLVVDDGSTDGTMEALAGLDRVTVIRLQRQFGAGHARAEGARRARGDLLGFLDADCYAPSNWVQTFVDILDADASLGGVGGKYCHQKATTALAHLARMEEEYFAWCGAREPLSGNPFGGNFAVRREVWERARTGVEEGMFPRMASGEDTVVLGELRTVAPIRFETTMTVLHGTIGSRAYIKRHFNRGLSGMTIILNHLGGPGDSSFVRYGGVRLALAAGALAMMPVFAAAALMMPAFALWLAGAAIAMLGIHVLLSARFLGRMDQLDHEHPPESPVTSWQRIGIRILLTLRVFLWAGGAVRGILRDLRGRGGRALGVSASVLHFFVPGRISKLFFFATSRCNAQCAFCLNADNVEHATQRLPAELTLDEVNAVARRLGRLPYLTVSGGEPFLRPDLTEVVEAFHRGAHTRFVTLTTNGSLPRRVLDTTRQILARCPNLFLTVQVSVDGVGDDHDRSRGLPGGFDAAASTLHGLGRLRERHPRLRIQIATLFDQSTMPRVADTLQHCHDRFACDQVFVYLVRAVGTRVTPRDPALLDAFATTVAQNERREWQGRKGGLWSRAVRALQEATYSDLLRIAQNGSWVTTCRASTKFATLWDDGRVGPCEVLDFDGGNVRDADYDLRAILRNDHVRTFYRNEVVRNRCTCEWQCALSVNLLYAPGAYGRILGFLARPGTMRAKEAG